MSDLDELKKQFSNLGNRIKPSFEMLGPNEEQTIFSGRFQLQQNQKEIPVDGEIKFSWFPSPRVRFEGKLLPGSLSELSLDKEAEVKLEGQQLGSCHIFNKSHRIGQSDQSGEYIEGACHGQVVKGDRTIPVERIQFSIPNFREYFGETVKEVSEEQITTDNARLQFENPEYLITIDKRKNYSDLYKTVKTRGGFLILYGGEIIKKKGPLRLNELNGLLYCFNNFMYFLNGRRTSLFFLSGKFQDEEIWKDFTGYNIDTFQYVTSWSRLIGIAGFNELWQTFYELWKEEKNKNFLEYLIHWYIEANNQSGYVEGSIIFVQTALELIYNWLIVENRKMIIGDDAANLSAANKIRIVLSQLNVDAEIPDALSYLSKLEDVNDGPEALVSVRNALVHGQEKKRAKAMAIPIQAKHEALQLGLWYVELSLLKILNFKGKYFNRVSGKLYLDMGDLPPWLQ